MKRYVDLSVTVSDATMSPPSTNMKLEVTPHRRGPGFWQVSSVRQSLHTGAHIDSPLHVFKDGITTAEISLDQVMGEAIVVDLSFVGPNHAITIDDLRRGGADDVRRGDIVLLRTDWTDRMYGRWPDYFVESPWFPPESAEWLVARGAKTIGFDFFVSPAPGRASDGEFLVEVKYRPSIEQFVSVENQRGERSAFFMARRHWPTLYFVLVTERPETGRSCFQALSLAALRTGEPI